MKILTFEQWVRKVYGNSHMKYLIDELDGFGWLLYTEDYYDYVVRKTRIPKRPLI